MRGTNKLSPDLIHLAYMEMTAMTPGFMPYRIWRRYVVLFI